MNKYNQSLQYIMALEATKAVNGTKEQWKEDRLFTTFTFEEEQSLIHIDTHVVYNNKACCPNKQIISLN